MCMYVCMCLREHGIWLMCVRDIKLEIELV